MRPLTPDASLRHFVGALLRERRLRVGWSQFTLGKRVGASASWISRIEKAERSAPADLLRRCDQVLGTGGLLARYSTLGCAADATSASVVLKPVWRGTGAPDSQRRSGLEELERSTVELRTTAGQVAASSTYLDRLVDDLNDAVQRARLDGLGDSQIAQHLSILGAPIAVRASLAADRDGTAIRILVASLMAVPEGTFDDGYRIGAASTDVAGRV
jgi:transcriptional regulator with XRE-family HTH domain